MIFQSGKSLKFFTTQHKKILMPKAKFLRRRHWIWNATHIHMRCRQGKGLQSYPPFNRLRGAVPHVLDDTPLMENQLWSTFFKQSVCSFKSNKPEKSSHRQERRPRLLLLEALFIYDRIYLIDTLSTLVAVITPALSLFSKTSFTWHNANRNG